MNTTPTPFDSVDSLLTELGTTRRTYFGFMRRHKRKVYKSFELVTKGHKVRIVHAPFPYLKHLQQRLSLLLEQLYSPPTACHGFARGKSIKTNATLHRKKRCVLNLDLKDFFPSITKRRIAGLLKSPRYALDPKVAKFIASMVTFEDTLPLGAPTSPIISNMIASRLDSQLLKLAKENKATYTRYADDITFSTTLKAFRAPICVASTEGIIGDQLKAAIQREGFTINEKKTRLAFRTGRQEVTGLTVNSFPNVRRKRINLVRALLHDWDRNGEEGANRRFAESLGKENLKWDALRMHLSGQLAFLSMVRGEADPIVYKLTLRLRKLVDPAFLPSRSDKMNHVKRLLDSLESEPDTKRAGYILEGAFAAFAEADEIIVSKPFRAGDNTAQLDGIIEVDGYYYVECKWWAAKVGATEIQTLVGKLTLSAAADARGLVVAKSGFTEEAENLARKSRRVILISYSELIGALNSEAGLAGLVRQKWLERQRMQ